MTELIKMKLKMLVDKITKSVILDSIDIDSIILSIRINKLLYNTNCSAIVNNIHTGEQYQCARKRKFGCFCGLHNNRKNIFNTVTYDKSDIVQVCLNLNNMLSKNIIDLKNNTFYSVIFNYNTYMVNSKTGDIFTIIDEEDYIKVDNLNSSQIPYILL